MLPLCDRLLANSAFTAGDVARYRRAQGLPDCDIPLIRLGDGFSQAGAHATVAHGLDRPYALVVSTIELRKNHALLVDAWQVLLARHGPDAVPSLVFAGREGPLSHDLMQRLRATSNLGGHVILRPSSSDAEIAALYRGCSFTLFPSLYEGWGLPVAESFTFGKPCLASNATSVPEVGGDLASYFDPLDLSATIACLEAILGDPAGLADWEAEIRRDFRPTPWSHTAEGLLAGVA
jgi:glycosyltransferase involved in cell wall biosynthesis